MLLWKVRQWTEVQNRDMWLQVVSSLLVGRLLHLQIIRLHPSRPPEAVRSILLLSKPRSRTNKAPVGSNRISLFLHNWSDPRYQIYQISTHLAHHLVPNPAVSNQWQWLAHVLQQLVDHEMSKQCCLFIRSCFHQIIWWFAQPAISMSASQTLLSPRHSINHPQANHKPS